MNTSLFDTAVAALPPCCFEQPPACGLILGSGWSPALQTGDVKLRLPFGDIPGLGASTVVGHAGELVLFEKYGIRVAAFLGRRHWYEGEGWTPVALPVELMRRLGVRDVLLTNAAGGIHPDLRPGSFLSIRDHINLSGLNPLQGPPVSGWGPRFPDQSRVYHPELRRLLQDAARNAGVALAEGVYAFTAGPAYETPAEIRGYAALGADAVGMSTVPEAMIANAAGLRVAAVSCISNAAAGAGSPPLDHAEVLAETQRVTPQMTALLEGFMRKLATEKPTSPDA